MMVFAGADSLITSDMLDAYGTAFSTMLATVSSVIIVGIPAVISVITLVKAANFMLKWMRSQLNKL